MSTAAVRQTTNIPLPVCLSENPHGLVSALDVLRIYAANFVRVGASLERCASSPGIKISPQGRADEHTRNSLFDLIETVLADCNDFRLPIAAEIAVHHKMFCEKAKTNLSFEYIGRAATEIFRTYQAEVRTKLFVHLSTERSSYFQAESLFGDEVSAAFPACASDILCAGDCYALEQDTACVMHLMRVLEIILAAFASKFSVDSTREQWHKIIGDIETAVGGLDSKTSTDWREQKEYFSEACKEFRYFKDAWRNHAMHARERYNSAQAKRILEHVGDFARHLSKRLRQDVI